MAIQSRLATGYWMRKAILTVLFVSFGFWAAYDGWILFPSEVAKWREYNDVYLPLDSRQREGGTLIGDDARKWSELKAKYPQAPKERTELDVWIQRWLILPVCFGVSALFIITWALSARRVYTYNDDGSLVAPEGTFRADEMTGIDMTRWMSKSIAMLEISGGPKGGGRAVKLDAWIYAELEDVIEALNRRFHPEEYKAEGTGADGDDEVEEVEQVAGLPDETDAGAETEFDANENHADADGDDLDELERGT